jgi:hypothetical protein
MQKESPPKEQLVKRHPTGSTTSGTSRAESREKQRLEFNKKGKELK